MYELCRVRLFSVGPPGARYQDVCLDLRGIGPAIQAPVQRDLFAADDPERSVRAAADAVAQHAQQSRFGTVTSPVRRHILGVSRADMPDLAAEWEQALRPRLRSLDDDLGNIGRHRGPAARHGDRGAAHVAARAAAVPTARGLSDWSGQEFIRIRFDDIEEAVLLDRLGDVVDQAATGVVSGGRDQRDGMSLLLQGVRAAMPKGVRVEMLKPDAVLRTERLRVSEIRDVFSGGQQLTAAIILYCTMAALRANDRGEGRRRHSGVLFLDNPIGRASVGYLLELQLGVAKARGAADLHHWPVRRRGPERVPVDRPAAQRRRLARRPEVPVGGRRHPPGTRSARPTGRHRSALRGADVPPPGPCPPMRGLTSDAP